jgi:hypothetical protein
MSAPTPLETAERITQFLERTNPTLFAGAGVGRRVGLPDWDQFLELLAKRCEHFDDATSAALIRERVARGNYLGAASVYKTCDSIPEGERWKVLADPFRQPIPKEMAERVVPLVSLGFTAIVTTNYDHSLHDACALGHHKWVVPVERTQLRGASLNKDFFIARVHGCAEHPTTWPSTSLIMQR